MGWRGALRTLGAVAREAERNAKRQQRALEQHRAALAQAEALQNAAQVVQNFADYLANIVSIHKSKPDVVEWSKLATTSPPREPRRSDVEEKNAQQRMNSYRPSVFAKLFHQDEKRKAELAQEVIAAQRRDDARYRTEMQAFETRLQEYNDQKELAEQVLARDSEAMHEVITARNPFTGISELGSSISFTIIHGRGVDADLAVHGESIIPKETVSLLKSGRASVKQMPKSQYYRLYQDYVCSAALRVARELFALLPIEDVVVTAVDKIINSETGHLEEQPILSVLIPRATIAQLNLDTIDPSDAMQNFLHRMDFRQTSGFRPVERLNTEHIGRTT